jgi:hypothetical protein
MVMIYGITGAKFSGKDTVGAAIIDAQYMFGRRAQRLLFAGALKDACCAIFGWTREQLEDHEFKETPEPITGKTPRAIMQMMGTDFGREMLHTDIWLRVLGAEVKRMTTNGITPVITDVRFDNEAEYVRALGGKIVHVVNPETVTRTDAHASENGVVFVEGDVLYTNDKTAGLQPLREFAIRLVKP